MRSDHIEKRTKVMSAKKSKNKRWMKVVSVLAAVTVFCTTYSLILPAITINATTYCGLDEHEHSDACYERQLICGLEEGDTVTESKTEIVTEQVLVDAGHSHDDSCYTEEQILTCENTEEDHEHTEACYETVRTLTCGQEEKEAVYEEKQTEVEIPGETIPGHVHTDGCYKKTLTCKLEEHKHGEECFANKTADLEDASIWEKTLPKKDEMKDDWKEDTLLIAKSQLGYHESEANFVVEDGLRRGYTRYGQMFGVPYGDWCAMFLQFSLHYAGVDERAMRGAASVPVWVRQEEQNNNFYEADNENYEPKATDIIYFDFDGKESADHIGIIEEIKKDEDGKIESIITIEGNTADAVRRNTYKPDDENIFGYSEIPDKMTEEELEKYAKGILEEEPEEEAEEEPKEVVGVDGKLTAEGEDYLIEVSYTADAGIPENATIKVSEITQGEEAYNTYNDKASEEVFGQKENLPFARFFDITILDEEGNEIQPKAEVHVVIDLKDEIVSDENVDVSAVHFVEDKEEPKPEKIETTLIEVEAEKETVSFDTDGFSVYGVVVYYTVDFYYTWTQEIGAPSEAGEGEEDSSITSIVADAVNTANEKPLVSEYHMPGGTEMLMSQLFEELGLERNAANIVDVEFTNDELVAFYPIQGDYKIISLQPFQTYETLTITFNDGEVLIIDVEDEWKYENNEYTLKNTIKNNKVTAVPTATEIKKILDDAKRRRLTNVIINIKGDVRMDTSVTIDNNMKVTFKGTGQGFYRADDSTYFDGAYFNVTSGSTLELQNLNLDGRGYSKINDSWTFSNSKINSTNTKIKSDGTGIFIESAGTVKITGGQIRGINANNNLSDLAASVGTLQDYGLTNTAPIYSKNGGTVEISGVTFKNNYIYQKDPATSVANNSGAVIVKNGKLDMTNSRIEDTVSSLGLVVVDGQKSGTKSKIENTTIHNNRVSGNDAAPIVAKNGADLTLNNDTITKNIAYMPNWDEITGTTGRTVDINSIESAYYNKLLEKPYANYSVPIAEGDGYRYSKKYFHGLLGDAGDEAATASAEGYLSGGPGVQRDPVRTAGALIVDGANVTMKGTSTIDGNAGDHGAVLVNSSNGTGGTFTQESGTISNNYGYNAGAVGIGNGTYNFSNGTISGNQTIWFGTVNVSGKSSSFNMGVGENAGNPVIDDNMTMHKGGGVYINSNSAKIEKGQISNNQAVIFGGGIYLERTNTIQMTSTELYDNTAGAMEYGHDIQELQEDMEEAQSSGTTTIRNNQTLGVGYGGGFWSCPTGSTIFDADEVSVHGNAINGSQAGKGGTDFSINDHADQLTFETTETWKIENVNNKPTDSNPVQGKYINNRVTWQNKKQLAIQNVTNTSKTSSGNYNVKIFGNKASTGGGIASNGYFIFTVESNKVDAHLNFTKTYRTGAWHNVEIGVKLKHNGTEIYSHTQRLTEGANTADFYLPAVLYKKNEQMPAQGVAYGKLMELQNNLKVGSNDLGNGWTLEVSEKVQLVNNGPYIDVFDTTTGYNVESSSTVTQTTQTDNEKFNEIIHEVEYFAKSSIENVEKAKKSLTIEKAIDGLQANDAQAYWDSENYWNNKIFWFEVSIKQPGSSDGYSTGASPNVTYSIFNENGIMTGDYYAMDGRTILSKDGHDENVKINGSLVNAGVRRLHWVNNGEQNSKAMLVPLRAGERVVFTNIPENATWTVREQTIDGGNRTYKAGNDTFTLSATDEASYNGKYQFDSYTYQKNETTTESKDNQNATIGDTLTSDRPAPKVTINNKEVPGTFELTKTVNGTNSGTLYPNEEYEFIVCLKDANGNGYNYTDNHVFYNVYNAGSTEPIKTALAGHQNYNEAFGGRGPGELGIYNEDGTNFKHGTTKGMRIKLKAGQTIKFENLPIGTTWSVEEVVDSNKYSVGYTVDGEAKTATNNKVEGTITYTPATVTSTTGNAGSTSSTSIDSAAKGITYCLNPHRTTPSSDKLQGKVPYDMDELEAISRWKVTDTPDGASQTRLPNRYYSGSSVNRTELAKLEDRIKNILIYGYHGQDDDEFPEFETDPYGHPGEKDQPSVDDYISATQEALYCVVNAYKTSGGSFKDYAVAKYGLAGDADADANDDGDLFAYIYNHRNDAVSKNAQLYIHYPTSNESSGYQAMISIVISDSNTPPVEPGNTNVSVTANNTEKSGRLVVSKIAEGTDNTSTDFTFEVTINGVTKDIKVKNGKSYTFDNLPLGSTWTVKEKNIPRNYKLRGYRVDGVEKQEESVSGTIGSNSSVNVVCVNEFAQGELSVTKTILPGAGGAMLYDDSQMFEFEASLTDTSGKGFSYGTLVDGRITNGDGVYYNIYEKDASGEYKLVTTGEGADAGMVDENINSNAASGTPGRTLGQQKVIDSRYDEAIGGRRIGALNNLNTGKSDVIKFRLKANQKIVFCSVPLNANWSVKEVGTYDKYVLESYSGGAVEKDANNNPIKVKGELNSSTPEATANVNNREVSDTFELTKSVTAGGESGASLYDENTLFKFVGSITREGSPLNTWYDGVTFSVYKNKGQANEELLKGNLVGFTTRQKDKNNNDTNGTATPDAAEPNSTSPTGVNLAMLGNGVRDTYWLSSTGNTEDMEFYLKAGETIVFENLPIDVEWNIKEVLDGDNQGKYELVNYTINSTETTAGADAPDGVSKDRSESTTPNHDKVVVNNREIPGELRLKKEVFGSSDFDQNTEFEFELTIGSESPRTIKLKADEETVINNLRKGDTWTLKEKSTAGFALEGYTVDGETRAHDSNNTITGTVGSDVSVIAKNKLSSGKFELKKVLLDHNGEEIYPDNQWFTFQGKIVGNGGNFNDDGGFNTADDKVIYKLYDEEGKLITDDNVPNHGQVFTEYGDGARRTGDTISPQGTNKTNKGTTIKLKAGWKIVFENLPPGARAEFKEINLPKGVWRKEFAINGIVPEDDTATATVTVVAGETASIVCTNEKRAPQVKIKKVDAGDRVTTLTGALFRLTSSDAVITDYINVHESNLGITDHNPAGFQWGYGSTIIGIVSYNSILNSKDIALDGEGYSINKRTGERLTNSNDKYIQYQPRTSAGIAKIVGVDANGIGDLGVLPTGTYNLEEIVAPRGYNKEPENIVITVKEDGTVTYIQPTNSKIEVSDTTGEYEGARRDISTLLITNTSGAVLPATGGIGTTIFTILGIILVVGAGAVLVIRKRQDK